MPEKKKAYIQLHISIFLWGFTAILGKVIDTGQVQLVWYRLIMVCICMLFFPSLWRNLKTVKPIDVLRISGIGCVIVMHWLCFYGSIKYADISVSLCCLATTSFFSSLLGPVFGNQKIKAHELLLGLLVIPGIYMIFHFSTFQPVGIILGLGAALFAAIFTLLNKRMVDTHHAFSLTFIEFVSGFIFLTALLPLYFYFTPTTTMHISTHDVGYIALLSVACTLLPFNLSLYALRHLSAFTANLSVNLEPVYGIIMAMFIFKEYNELNTGFYAGAAVILLSVFIHPFLQSKYGEKKNTVMIE